MDVDAIISSDGQRLSENEISRLMREKKCFYCKGDNHRADKCWKKHGKPNQGGSMGKTTACNMDLPEDPTVDELVDVMQKNMNRFSEEVRLDFVEKLMPQGFPPALD